MNSENMDKTPAVIEIEDDDLSTIVDDDISDENSNKGNPSEQNYHQHQQFARAGTHMSRASLPHSASGATGSSKRQKDISPCYVCGAKAHGYNFDQSEKMRTSRSETRTSHLHSSYV